MNIRFGVLFVASVLFFSIGHAAPLGKYSDSQPSVVPKQTNEPDIIQRKLSVKMQEVIQRLNAMPVEERRKWIHYYTLKMKAAQQRGDFLESGYYSGILAGVGIESE